MSTRECYRRCVRATRTLGSAGYNHHRVWLARRLKEAFETGSASPQQLLRTTEFVERAARYKGTEYDVIRNMLTVDAAWSQRKRSVATRRAWKEEEKNQEEEEMDQLMNRLEYVVATFTVPGPKEYSEALRQGKLPEITESTQALSRLIKYSSQSQNDEYYDLVKGLNETMGLALPVFREEQTKGEL
ncbi:hypothetical protein CJU90_5922 [Yarrowia sp. C11]|nr:hypothetical protein CJU90_5922 [Yarrowia sp. C11]KAG5370643.1 hypothetical protein CKK34_0764 [Yarrowia sp. E02]